MAIEEAAPPKRKFKMVPKGKEGGAVAQFRRIEVSLLEEGVLSFDLFLFDRESRELISYLNKGSTFSGRMKEELLGKGIEVLYVPVKDKRAFDAYVEARLSEVLKSDIPPRRKLELTYTSAQQIMEDLFTDYEDNRNIQRAKSVVSRIVDLFSSENEALPNSVTDLIIHDYHTYSHSLHVCLYGTAMALKVYSNKCRKRTEGISFGLIMHDIGKTRIRPDILKKPGKLTEDEWREIKKHPRWGYRMLEDMRELTPEVVKIVLGHHERVDGSGYPSELRGHEVSVLSRICSFADVFDAVTANRPYRMAVSIYDALKTIRDEMHCLHDRSLFETFVRLFAKEKISGECRPSSLEPPASRGPSLSTPQEPSNR